VASVAEEVALALWRPERDIARFCVEATSEAERAYARTCTYLAESKEVANVAGD
jgi:hypothetical protein